MRTSKITIPCSVSDFVNISIGNGSTCDTFTYVAARVIDDKERVGTNGANIRGPEEGGL